MRPTDEQVKVLLAIQHRYQIDHCKGNKTFLEYIDIWWDFLFVSKSQVIPFFCRIF